MTCLKFLLWVGTGTQLQARKLPANSDQEMVITSKLENVHIKVDSWQKVIDEDPITFEGIKNHHDELKGIFIHFIKKHYMP